MSQSHQPSKTLKEGLFGKTLPNHPWHSAVIGAGYKKTSAKETGKNLTANYLHKKTGHAVTLTTKNSGLQFSTAGGGTNQEGNSLDKLKTHLSNLHMNESKIKPILEKRLFKTAKSLLEREEARTTHNFFTPLAQIAESIQTVDGRVNLAVDLTLTNLRKDGFSNLTGILENAAKVYNIKESTLRARFESALEEHAHEIAGSKTALNEEAEDTNGLLEQLQSLTEKTAIFFEDGSAKIVTPDQASILVTLFESLGDTQKETMKALLSESAKKFDNLLGFAQKQNSINEAKERDSFDDEDKIKQILGRHGYKSKPNLRSSRVYEHPTGHKVHYGLTFNKKGDNRGDYKSLAIQHFMPGSEHSQSVKLEGLNSYLRKIHTGEK